MLVKSYGLTDIGTQRIENQDYYDIDNNLGLYIIADGNGNYGRYASELTTKELILLFEHNKPQLINQSNYERINFIIKNIKVINDKVRVQLDNHSGSTLVFVYIIDNTAFVTNVGDSLAFLIRNGELRQLTKEHNLAGQLFELGEITREEARTHPSRRFITSYIGCDKDIEISTTYFDIKKGDRILICSDGLTGLINDKKLLDILNQSKQLELLTKKLIVEANKKGGSDNITLILIDIISV